jgi:hypothetical protein
VVVMMVMATFASVATAHALVLTVSHDLLFRQPPLFATAPMPPLFIDCCSHRTSLSPALTAVRRCELIRADVIKRWQMRPSPSVLPRCCKPLFVRATPINARLTDETSRSASSV